MEEQRGISTPWIFASMGIILAFELLLGGVLPHLLAGRFVAHPTALKIQVLLMLVSFFLGGFIVGLVSPGVRLAEPAIGAAASVGITFLFTAFTPLVFYRFSMGRLLVGAIVAFLIAMAGAHLGERATGK